MRTSKQLTDLIKNESQRTGINAQILLKRYLMECFLERLSASEYRGNFIIKGGILVSSLVGISSRTTMDVDLTVKNFPLDKGVIKNIIEELVSENLNNVHFTLAKIENIREESDYECFRVSLNVAMDRIRESIKLDITVGDRITPQEIKYDYKLMLEKRTIPLFSYNIETVLAEKIESILSKGTLNTRMRDYYDCFLLSKVYRGTINFALLGRALNETIKFRGTNFIYEDVKQIIQEIKESQELKLLWSNYQKNNSYVESNSYENIVAEVIDIINVAIG